MEKSNDMKEMILKEIQSIPSLEERVIFKNLMEEVFLELYETNEQMYAELENGYRMSWLMMSIVIGLGQVLSKNSSLMHLII